MFQCTPFLITVWAAGSLFASSAPVSEANQDTVVKTTPLKASPKASLHKSPGATEKPFRLIAIGGGLSSGIQDGELYRKGQLTCFPNLISKQFGAEFPQPLLDEGKAVGTGFGTGRPVVAHETGRDNLVFKQDGRTAGRFTGTFNNYAFPYFSRRMRNKADLPAEANPFFQRLLTAQDRHDNLSVLDWLKREKAPDFFLLEVGFDDLVQSILHNGGGISNLALEELDRSDEAVLVSHLTGHNAKGLLVTVPDVLKFPFFQQFRWDILKKYNVYLKVPSAASPEPVSFNPARDLLLPGKIAEQIVKGELKGTICLNDQDVVSKDPYDDEFLLYSPVTFNNYKIRRAAAKHHLAVADLFSLYNRVLSGEYVSDDGVQVDPAWPGGNFFSSDGIYPTPLGQAVIANECIRAINAHYNLTIPLVQTRHFTSE